MKKLIKIIIIAAIILAVASSETLSNYILNFFNTIVTNIKNYF